MKGKKSFWDELKKRNVVKGAISYIVVAWLLMRITALLGDLLEMPLWVSRSLFYLLLICFPIWLVLSWIYDATPQGIKRTSNKKESAVERKKTNRRFTKTIIGLLALVLIVLVVDRFLISEKNIKYVKEQEFAVTSGKVNKSIAVLPFLDFSQKNENEYFADGLTEELSNLLSQIKNLKVTSRTSAFAFKNSELDIPTIARKLNVNYILEGSVRKVNDDIRITAQLIEASTDKHLWSQTYDRASSNVFIIQDEVAEAVVKSLQLNLLNDTPAPVSTKTTPEAHKLYLQSLQASYYSSDTSQLQKAVQLANNALKNDPEYIPALLLLSRLYENQANNPGLTFKEGYTMAKNAANRVLEIDTDNGLAYAYLADYQLCYDWDFHKAKELSAKALALDGNNPEIIHLAAALAISLGNIDSAVRLMEYALELDPLNPDVRYQLSNVYYYADRLSEAEAEAKKCIALQPNRWSVHYYLTRILLAQNKISEAQKAIELEKDDGWRLQMFSDIYYKMGDEQKSNQFMNKLIEKYQNEMAYQIAESYAFRNNKEMAFIWLDKAYKVHDVGLNEILAEPRFRTLHMDPRWNKFIIKMGFPYNEK